MIFFPFHSKKMRLFSVVGTALLVLIIVKSTSGAEAPFVSNRQRQSLLQSKTTDSYKQAITSAIRNGYKKNRNVNKPLTQSEFLKAVICDYSNLFCSTNLSCSPLDITNSIKDLKNIKASSLWSPDFCDAKFRNLLDEDFINKFSPDKKITFEEAAKVFAYKIYPYDGKPKPVLSSEEALLSLSRQEVIPIAIEKLGQSITEAQIIEMHYRIRFYILNKPHRSYDEKGRTLIAIQPRKKLYLPDTKFDTILGERFAPVSIILSEPLNEDGFGTTHSYLSALNALEMFKPSINFIYRPAAFFNSCEPNCIDKKEEKRNEDAEIIIQCFENSNSIDAKCQFILCYNTAIKEKLPFTNQDVLKKILKADTKKIEEYCLASHATFSTNKELAKISECIFQEKSDQGFLTFIDQFLKEENTTPNWEVAGKNSGATTDFIRSCMANGKFPRNDQYMKISRELSENYFLIVDNKTNATYLGAISFDIAEIMQDLGFSPTLKKVK